MFKIATLLGMVSLSVALILGSASPGQEPVPGLPPPPVGKPDGKPDLKKVKKAIEKKLKSPVRKKIPKKNIKPKAPQSSPLLVTMSNLHSQGMHRMEFNRISSKERRDWMEASLEGVEKGAFPGRMSWHSLAGKTRSLV